MDDKKRLYKLGVMSGLQRAAYIVRLFGENALKEIAAEIERLKEE